jgi:hypothetical protein
MEKMFTAWNPLQMLIPFLKAVLASNPVYVSFKIFYNNSNVKVTNRILTKEV